MSTDDSPDVTERGKYGDVRIVVDELENSFQPIDDAGDVKAKVWESDAGDRRLYLRIRDHDDGRRFNEYSVDLGQQPVDGDTGGTEHECNSCVWRGTIDHDGTGQAHYCPSCGGRLE